MARDNAPITNTCPMIDDVVSSIDFIMNRVVQVDDDTEQEFKNAMTTIEKVRDANATLRDWGNDEHNKAVDLEDHNEYLEKELSKLRDQLEDRDDDINVLKLEKAALESELYHMQKQIQ